MMWFVIAVKCLTYIMRLLTIPCMCFNADKNMCQDFWLTVWPSMTTDLGRRSATLSCISSRSAALSSTKQKYILPHILFIIFRKLRDNVPLNKCKFVFEKQNWPWWPVGWPLSTWNIFKIWLIQSLFSF